MAAAEFALGVDFGTSNTVAMLRWPDGRARPLLVDGSPLLPSAVYADPGGHLLVGRDAVHSARLDPGRYEPNPKRRIDDQSVLLGDRELPIGSVVVVHDFGAGTFDVSVVARTGNGFDVLAVDGRDDIGGLDIDAAVVAHLGRQYGSTPEWRRLTNPSTVDDRRNRRMLWDDVRVAKERLSRAQSADIAIPVLGSDVHLTRAELEELARPVLDQTVRVTEGALRWAKLAEGRLAGVFLVGGASRIPLVATLLHR